MSLSDYAEEKLVKHLFGITAFTAPTAFHLALSTADPTDAGSGMAEPSGGSYARVNITSVLAWNAGAKRVENNATITFPTASASWGTITHFAIFDAGSGGNLLVKGALTSSKSYASGDVCSFNAADLTVAMTGGFTEYLREKLLKHLFNLAAYTQPAIYVALSTADPGATGSGLAEPAGSSYARVLVAGAGWTWDTGNQRAKNVGATTFTTATGSWGTITHAAICDASSAGNVLLSSAVAASKSYSSGDQATFPAGDLTIALD